MTGPSRARENRLIWKRFRFHSRTFSLAALFLPRDVRTPVATLYMFCRHVDEIADRAILDVGADGALGQLAAAQDALDRTRRGDPPKDLLWLRLAEVDARFRLAYDPMYELIDGARWDLEARPIRDDDDLIRYSNLVGGSIGAMMLPLLALGQDKDAETRARDLGIGMQITNILRDVGEDLRVLSRSYVPISVAERFHVDPWSPDPQSSEYRRLTEHLMGVAERYYESGLGGIDMLPVSMRAGIRAATRLYRQILNEIRRNGYDNISQRAYVPWYRKVRCLAADDYARQASLLTRAVGL